MSTATLSSKFQISIPKKIREALDFHPGQQFEFIAIGRSIRLVPQVTIKELAGSASGANPSGYRDRGDRVASYVSKGKQGAHKPRAKSRA